MRQSDFGFIWPLGNLKNPFFFNWTCLTTPQQSFKPSTFSVVSYDRSFECAKKCKEIAQTMHRKISLQLCRYSQCSAYKYLKIECKKCAGKGLNSFISNEINKDNLKLHNYLVWPNRYMNANNIEHSFSFYAHNNYFFCPSVKNNWFVWFIFIDIQEYKK